MIASSGESDAVKAIQKDLAWARLRRAHSRLGEIEGIIRSSTEDNIIVALEQKLVCQRDADLVRNDMTEQQQRRRKQSLTKEELQYLEEYSNLEYQKGVARDLNVRQDLEARQQRIGRKLRALYDENRLCEIKEAEGVRRQASVQEAQARMLQERDKLHARVDKSLAPPKVKDIWNKLIDEQSRYAFDFVELQSRGLIPNPSEYKISELKQALHEAEIEARGRSLAFKTELKLLGAAIGSGRTVNNPYWLVYMTRPTDHGSSLEDGELGISSGVPVPTVLRLGDIAERVRVLEEVLGRPLDDVERQEVAVMSDQQYGELVGQDVETMSRKMSPAAHEAVSSVRGTLADYRQWLEAQLSHSFNEDERLTLSDELDLLERGERQIDAIEKEMNRASDTASRRRLADELTRLEGNIRDSRALFDDDIDEHGGDSDWYGDPGSEPFGGNNGPNGNGLRGPAVGIAPRPPRGSEGPARSNNIERVNKMGRPSPSGTREVSGISNVVERDTDALAAHYRDSGTVLLEEPPTLEVAESLQEGEFTGTRADTDESNMRPLVRPEMFENHESVGISEESRPQRAVPSTKAPGRDHIVRPFESDSPGKDSGNKNLSVHPVPVRLAPDPVVQSERIPVQSVSRIPIHGTEERLNIQEDPENILARFHQPELVPQPIVRPVPEGVLRKDEENQKRTKRHYPPIFPDDVREEKKKKVLEDERKKRRQSLLAQEEEAGITPRPSAAKLHEDDVSFNGQKIKNEKHWRWKNLYS